MIIPLPNDCVARWDGGHYFEIFSRNENGYEYDFFSFGWEKDKPTQLDALQAFLVWKNLTPTMSDPSDKV